MCCVFSHRTEDALKNMMRLVKSMTRTLDEGYGWGLLIIKDTNLYAFSTFDTDNFDADESRHTIGNAFHESIGLLDGIHESLRIFSYRFRQLRDPQAGRLRQDPEVPVFDQDDPPDDVPDEYDST